jgi:plastocyanin
VAAYGAVGALSALTVTLLLVATPAWAGRTLTISIGPGGPSPAMLAAMPGDTVLFRNDDPALPHQLRSTSGNWTFDTGPLLPGATATAGTLTGPGEYVYSGATLDSFTGEVVVSGATGNNVTPSQSDAMSPSSSATPTPTPTATATATPTETPTASAHAAAPQSPPPAAPSRSVSARSSGTITPSALSPPASPTTAPLTGAFPDLRAGGTASGLPSGPAPALAPVPTGAAGTGGWAAAAAGVPVGSGSLSADERTRRYGLPAVLAGVAAAGIGSLLVRLLLAHPAAYGRSRGRHASNGGQGGHSRPRGQDGAPGVPPGE